MTVGGRAVYAGTLEGCSQREVRHPRRLDVEQVDIAVRGERAAFDSYFHLAFFN